MDSLDVFRIKRDNSILWITGADSLHTAREIVKLHALHPSEEFLVLDNRTNEPILLRAEGCRPFSHGRFPLRPIS